MADNLEKSHGLGEKEITEDTSPEFPVVNEPLSTIHSKSDSRGDTSPTSDRANVAAVTKQQPGEGPGHNQDEPLAEQLQRVETSGEEYSVLTVTQKRCIVLTASLASLFSPMATSIYYPSLNTIAHDLNVSDSEVNLTITVFLIIQGIAPAFVADLADRQGRRPMYILCFIIFNIANVALACSTSFVELLVWRMIQASGSSGTVALANGVVGDIITSAERGQYVAYASIASILGPMVAPVLGGIIGEYAGWHWIFWFQFIFSTAVFIPLILFMPETCRRVVHNGSIPPPLLSRNITDTIRHRHRQQKGLTYNKTMQEDIAKNYKFRSPNPLSTIKVLLDLESAILLVTTGLGLGCFYAISTGVSVAFAANYGFSQLEVSLMFIPFGAGSLVSAFTTGKTVDWNFRRWCRKLNVPIVGNRKQDLSNFPIERARCEIAFPVFFIAGSFVIAYGWMLTIKVSVAVPVIFLFFAGWALTTSFQVMNVLMVDIYPGKASTATAANNFVRCEIGAVFTAILLPMQEAIGWGWSYTLLVLLYVGFAPVLLIVMKRGIGWRAKRKAKEDKKKGERQERKDLKNAAMQERDNAGTTA